MPGDLGTQVGGTKAQKKVILLASNEDEDIELIDHALQSSRLLNSFHVVRTAEDALAYATGQGRFADRNEFPLPELFLLDLGLPDALTLLPSFRSQEELRGIRVIVLASWGQTPELSLAFQGGANSFIFKPVRKERLMDTIMSMNGCWVWVNNPAPNARRVAVAV